MELGGMEACPVPHRLSSISVVSSERSTLSDHVNVSLDLRALTAVTQGPSVDSETAVICSSGWMRWAVVSQLWQ